MILFSNPGKKLKICAIVSCLISWAIFFLLGLKLFNFPGDYFVDTAIEIWISGFFLGWMSGLGIYGWGELIENVDIIRECVEDMSTLNQGSQNPYGGFPGQPNMLPGGYPGRMNMAPGSPAGYPGSPAAGGYPRPVNRGGPAGGVPPRNGYNRY